MLVNGGKKRKEPGLNNSKKILVGELKRWGGKGE